MNEQAVPSGERRQAEAKALLRWALGGWRRPPDQDAGWEQAAGHAKSGELTGSDRSGAQTNPRHTARKGSASGTS